MCFFNELLMTHSEEGSCSTGATRNVFYFRGMHFTLPLFIKRPPCSGAQQSPCCVRG